jgi:hypothetical protein
MSGLRLSEESRTIEKPTEDIMSITEYSFSWLYQAQEERLTQELEFKRIAAERVEQQVPAPSVPKRVSRWLRRMSVAGGTM